MIRDPDGPGAPERLELLVGRLLAIGVAVSTTVLAAGLLATIAGVDDRIALLLLNVGLAVLIATPPIRVLVSLIEYVRARDWFFVATALAILTILAGSLLAALRGM